MTAIEAPGMPQRRYADFGLRFVAWLFDTRITGAFGYFVGALADQTGNVVIQLLTIVVAYFGGMAYAIAFVALAGQTPGKWFLRLRIVGPDPTVRGIGWGRAIVRYLGTVLSTLGFLLGYLAIAMDPDRQGWHDRIAGTHVIREGVPCYHGAWQTTYS